MKYAITFEGVLDYGGDPATRRPNWQISPAFVIGGRDVVDELYGSPLDGKQVRLTVADHDVTGKLDAWIGSQRWSEYTPGENDTLSVGDLDLLIVALGLDGQEVTMTVEGEASEAEVAEAERDRAPAHVPDPPSITVVHYASENSWWSETHVLDED